MIRHRPAGSGHPYDTAADQRVPVRPLDGETVELRVLATSGTAQVTCEWDDGTSVRTFPLAPCVRERTAVAGAEGHLTAAAARAAGGRNWVATSPPIAFDRPVRYRFTATAGRLSRTRWHDVAASAWSRAGGTISTHGNSRLVDDSVTWLADLNGTHRVRFALRLTPREHLVGFGERYDALDQRGRLLDATVFEQYKGQGAAGRTYLPMPFAHVLGGDGWAFHVETAHRTWYDSTAADGVLWIEADLDRVPDTRLDVRFFDGSVGEVLHAWLPRVGEPTELPDWVFGLWASGNEWNTQEIVEARIDRHRKEDIPVSVVVIEAWSDESTFTAFRDAQYPVHDDGAPHELSDFTFPRDGAWPDPKAMVDRLHDQNVRVVLWQIPLQKMRPAPVGQARADADALVRHDYVVRERNGARPYRNRGWWFPGALMPDLTSPEARAWWLAKRRYLVDEVGVDGFKTDGGEHAWGEDLRYADGSAGVAGNNRLSVHYAAAYGDLLRSCGKAPVTFSRSGYTGSQAHGAFWAGDEDSTWAALRGSLTAGLSAAACGVVYWGWDLAGFSGPVPDAELYLRATEVSTFLPIMQYHSEFNHHRQPSRDRTPWNIAEQTSDTDVLPIFGIYARLRERLRPYLAEHARRAIETGWPLLRAQCLAYPDDRASWAHPYQYLFGDDLLVAPVVEAGVTRTTVHLPPGRWISVWNGRIETGDRTVTTNTPRDRIAIWCRQRRWTQLRPAFATATRELDRLGQTTP